MTINIFGPLNLPKFNGYMCLLFVLYNCDNGAVTDSYSTYRIYTKFMVSFLIQCSLLGRLYNV